MLFWTSSACVTDGGGAEDGASLSRGQIKVWRCCTAFGKSPATRHTSPRAPQPGTHHRLAKGGEGQAHEEAVGDGNHQAQRLQLERERGQARRAARPHHRRHLRQLHHRAAGQDAVAQALRWGAAAAFSGSGVLRQETGRWRKMAKIGCAPPPPPC